jgi:alpha-2-macroglobulin
MLSNIRILIAIACVIMAQFSCKFGQKATSSTLGWDNPNIEKYIAEHSPNTVSKKDDIVIRLSKKPTKIAITHGAEIVDNIVSISPQSGGKFIWKDDLTMVYTHDQPLSSDTKYAVSVNFDKLYEGVASEDKSATLTLTTVAQNYRISNAYMEYLDLDGKTVLAVKGIINSNDHVENGEIEKIFTASQNNNAGLKTTWDHISSKEHHFTSYEVARSGNDEKVKISLTGTEVSTDVHIPRKGEFSISDISVTGNKKVEIIFSDPLQKNQTLNGLISVKELESNPAYTVDINKVTLFLENLDVKDATIIVNSNIKNNEGKALGAAVERKLSFATQNPKVQALRPGVIIPETDKIWFPFQAANVKNVKIEITKIYQNNVLQFLQYHSLDDTYDLTAVGKIIHTEEVDLSKLTSNIEDGRWHKFTLDLGKMITLDKGAIYNVAVTFDKNDILNFDCGNDNVENEDGPQEDMYNEDNSPCQDYYYYDNVFINNNILSSNIGLIAKGSESNEWTIIASTITDAAPMSGVEVEFYDFQKQPLGKGITDSNGQLKFVSKEKCSFVIAKSNGEYGYLNLLDQNENPLTEFEVNGKEVQSGLDAFIYPERGVYRPGDTIHAGIMLHNHGGSLNTDYPVRVQMEDSRGKLVYERSSNKHIKNLYRFDIPTKEAYPTGTYKLIANLGNEKFYKTIKVETVKPNRLKITYANEAKELKLYDQPNLSYMSQWLHGASAGGLKTEVDVTWAERDITFPKYKSYKFTDPTRSTSIPPSRIHEGSLNQAGQTSYTINDVESLQPSSALTAHIKTRVYEQSGNFSDDYNSIPAHRYASYIGINVPKSQWGGNYMKSGIAQSMPIVCLTPDGKPIPNRKLSVGLYQAEWDWWYNESNYNLLKYNTNTHTGALKTYMITTNGQGQASFKENFQDYGNYMIRICDTETGHCTGDYFYTSVYGDPPSNNGAPQILHLEANAENYKPGDNIQLNIPSNANSKIIVSLERGGQVIQVMRVDGKDKMTIVSIPVTEAMSPNVYAHVSLLQPYKDNPRGLPLRMYGVLPLKITNPSQSLDPKITAPKQVSPGEDFNVVVSESKGKEMAYTLAIVDEGLLDLTRFKTPDPLDYFHAKQALNVNTWDLYNKVIDPHGIEIENLFSIGGDASALSLNSVKKANRFVPVVKYLGPFLLNSGEKKSHKISIENYVGSVKIMVVGKSETAFGKAEAICPVKKDLMVQTTLPRVLAPGDEMQIPANIFAMNNNIKNVEASMKYNNLLQPTGPTSNTINFTEQGDKLTNFGAKVRSQVGIAEIESFVKSGSLNSTDKTQINISNPNPIVTNITDFVIEPGKKSSIPISLIGMAGTNSLAFEVSNGPSYNIAKRLNYLIQYPHGCVEQTTSAALPQLYIADVMDVDEKKKAQIKNNVANAINKLSSFQTSNGGFGYWPGDRNTDEWATSYVGQFLIEAKNKNYFIPSNILPNWLTYQKNKARDYRDNEPYKNHVQAYRLYTLAKYGSADIGAMNRLKAISTLDQQSTYTLAAAYALAGKKDIASSIITTAEKKINTKQDQMYYDYTYGSPLRNNAMVAEAYLASGLTAKAAPYVSATVKDLRSTSMYNTHGISYALMVIQKYYGNNSSTPMLGELSIGSKKLTPINAHKNTVMREATVDDSKKNHTLVVHNQGKGKMYLRIINDGKEEVKVPTAPINKNLSIRTTYTDNKGSAIDISNLTQGSNIIAHITVTNPGSYHSFMKNLALTYSVPAGWEINNDKMHGTPSQNASYQYQDIRDASVNTYFSLSAGSKTFDIPLTATYAGKYYFAPTLCTDMYNSEIMAATSSQYVTVAPVVASQNLEN